MKIALIGAGTIGAVHSEVISMKGLEFSAICDILPSAAENIKNTFSPNAALYTDWQTMLDEVNPDVVHICTPHYLHKPMVIGALERGINVLCEKPLCIDPDELDEILEAEKKSSAQLGVSLQNRYNETNLFVKNYLKDKQVVCAHATVAWHRDVSYYTSSDWRGTWSEEGGGVLINQAIHTLDLLRWFCGDPEEVCATASNFTLKNIIEVEDTLSASFFGEHPFTFFATNSNAYNLPITIQMRLSNKDSIIILPNCVMINGEIRFNVKNERFLSKSYYGIGHELLISDFYNCIENNVPFAINGAEAAKVMRLVFAAYKSGGEKVSI